MRRATVLVILIILGQFLTAAPVSAKHPIISKQCTRRYAWYKNHYPPGGNVCYVEINGQWVKINAVSEADCMAKACGLSSGCSVPPPSGGDCYKQCRQNGGNNTQCLKQCRGGQTAGRSNFIKRIIDRAIGILGWVGPDSSNRKRPVPPPVLPGPRPPSSGDGCIVTGCSKEICSDHEVITTCQYKPEYQCLKYARCERQSNGQCGWTQTPLSQACLGRTDGSSSGAGSGFGRSGQNQKPTEKGSFLLKTTIPPPPPSPLSSPSPSPSPSPDQAPVSQQEAAVIEALLSPLFLSSPTPSAPLNPPSSPPSDSSPSPPSGGMGY